MQCDLALDMQDPKDPDLEWDAYGIECPVDRLSLHWIVFGRWLSEWAPSLGFLKTYRIYLLRGRAVGGHKVLADWS